MRRFFRKIVLRWKLEYLEFYLETLTIEHHKSIISDRTFLNEFRSLCSRYIKFDNELYNLEK